jgi:CheY-like chemotaxis protein
MTHWVADTVPEFLIGDWGRLRQVLTNLVGNAIKFTGTGEVAVHVESQPLIKSAIRDCCAISFKVIDTGIGIPADKTALIFEPFSQADGSVTRSYGGTGLGLSISRGLVQLMGASLAVLSEVNRGSTFVFTVELPVASEPVAMALQLATNDIDQITKKSRLHVLVAEDNPINQKIVRINMEKRGHRVSLANNGSEALVAYRASHFDLILMDVQMPVMDGLSAAAAIRSFEAQNNARRTPIIGLTAHALRADRDRCLRAGMDRHLAKPFKTDELIELIEELTS